MKFGELKIGERFEYNILWGFEEYTKIEPVKRDKGGFFNAIRKYDNKLVIFRDGTEVFELTS